MNEFFRRNHFLLRRLHSLTGIVPVGGFLLLHFYENSKAFFGGPEAYNEAVRMINSLPVVWVLEVFGIFLPLYFHALYGIYIAYDSKHNVSNYGYGRNWAFFFQRMTGIITLFFVTWHLWQFRFQKFMGAYGPHFNPADPNSVKSMTGLPSFEIVQKALSHQVVIGVYIIGIVAAAYHLCNGLYTFLITWGITVGPRSQRVSNLITNAAFVGVSALGIAALWGFIK